MSDFVAKLFLCFLQPLKEQLELVWFVGTLILPLKIGLEMYVHAKIEVLCPTIH